MVNQDLNLISEWSLFKTSYVTFGPHYKMTVQDLLFPIINNFKTAKQSIQSSIKPFWAWDPIQIPGHAYDKTIQMFLLSLYRSIQGQFDTFTCRLFSREKASYTSESSFSIYVMYSHSFHHCPLLITLGSVCLEFLLSYFIHMVYNGTFSDIIANP